MKSEGENPMKKSTKMILGASAIVAGAAAIGTAAFVVTKKLMSFALSRESGKQFDQHQTAKKMLKGSDKIDDFLQATANAEEMLRGVDARVWAIESFDGHQLVAHWYPCENAKRIIVAMHGWRSSWSKDFALIASFWREQGCHILFVEQRGQGDSGGEYMGFGMTERFDCRDWINRVNAQNTEQLPIYLVGMSMGAATVLMTSALELPDTVHGIIADCGYTSPHAIWKYVANNKFRIPYDIFGRLVDDICRKATNFGSKEITATDALKETTVPVLFVHGTDDHFVPVTMTYENYKACASEKRLLVVPGADHGMSYYIDPVAYETALKDFWKEYDPKQPKQRGMV